MPSSATVRNRVAMTRSRGNISQISGEITQSASRLDMELGSLIADIGATGSFDAFSGSVPAAKKKLTAIKGSSPDLIVRPFVLKGGHEALLAYAEGMVDANQVDRDILLPLEFLDAPRGGNPQELITDVKQRLTSIGHVSEETKWSNVLPKLTYGSTILFLEGARSILVLDTTKFPARPISQPQSETSLKGPQAALNEVLLTGINQIRRTIRTPDLTFETLEMGRYTHTSVAIGYIRGLANPDLVSAVRRRLQAIERDYILYVNDLQSYLSNESQTVFPLIRSTERVDWVARDLLNGKVVVMVDNDPFVISVPSVFMDFMQTTQDYVFSPWKAAIVRGIRFVGMLVGLYLMPLYIALFSVNPDLVPTKLVMAVAGSRQGVPFPPVMEVIIMWFILEIVIEAAIRLPQKLGQTVGLIGAVVVGTAIVRAGLVDDIMIVVATMAALGYFTAPAFEMTVPWRLLFWVMIAAAFTYGILGIVLATTCVIAHVASIEVFGVPYTSPFGPLRIPDLKDAWFRAPTRELWHRPTKTRSLDVVTADPHVAEQKPIDLTQVQQDITK